MFYHLVIARSVGLAIAGMLLACGLSARAQEFSADLAYIYGTAPLAGRGGRIQVEIDKVRFETPDLPDGFFLIDGATPVAYFVRAAHRLFMDANQTSQLTQILVRVDPSDPCRQWQTMAVVAGATAQGGQWTCERVGEDTVDGRAVTMYRATSPTHRHISAWIDPQLKFVLKLQTDDGATVELKNIRQGPQAADLFKIPSNYGKFDPQQLIERIKQSDVWVEPHYGPQ